MWRARYAGVDERRILNVSTTACTRSVEEQEARVTVPAVVEHVLVLTVPAVVERLCDDPRRSVLDALQLLNTADWSTIQHSVAVVQPRQYQAAGQSSGEFCGQQVTNMPDGPGVVVAVTRLCNVLCSVRLSRTEELQWGKKWMMLRVTQIKPVEQSVDSQIETENQRYMTNRQTHRHTTLIAVCSTRRLVGWLRLVAWQSVIERRSSAGVLSLSCARPVADGWPVVWVNRPLWVNQLGQLSLSSLRGR